MDQLHEINLYQGGGNRTVPYTIMGKCFQLSKPTTTTFNLDDGKCFWAGKLETTTVTLNVGKCISMVMTGYHHSYPHR